MSYGGREFQIHRVIHLGTYECTFSPKLQRLIYLKKSFQLLEVHKNTRLVISCSLSTSELLNILRCALSLSQDRNDLVRVSFVLASGQDYHLKIHPKVNLASNRGNLVEPYIQLPADSFYQVYRAPCRIVSQLPHPTSYPSHVSSFLRHPVLADYRLIHLESSSFAAEENIHAADGPYLCGPLIEYHCAFRASVPQE